MGKTGELKIIVSDIYFLLLRAEHKIVHIVMIFPDAILYHHCPLNGLYNINLQSPFGGRSVIMSTINGVETK